MLERLLKCSYIWSFCFVEIRFNLLQSLQNCCTVQLWRVKLASALQSRYFERVAQPLIDSRMRNEEYSECIVTSLVLCTKNEQTFEVELSLLY